MTSEEVDAFLDEPHHVTMCTLNRDGSVHAVPMWYGFADGRLAVHTKARSQKVLNLRRDDRLTCLVEAGTAYGELRGVELVGRGEIVDGADRLWEVGRSVYERYVGAYDETKEAELAAVLAKRVAVVLRVERTVSWDHRKLA